jgi:S-methylmethionine-dependent homocysteine/selenocysteine methylase
MSDWVSDLRGGRTLLVDGGTGSELRRRGFSMRDDVWSALAAESHYALLRTIHCDYISAGADIVTTNTFATSRFVLEAAGLGAQFETLNRAAVRAAIEARELAGRAATIAGSLSCLPPRFDPRAYPEPADEERAYRELAALLVDAGAEVLVLEMLEDTRHAALACAAARTAGVPFWLGLSCRVRNGELVAFDFPKTRLEDVVAALTPYGPAVVTVMHSPVAAVEPALLALRLHWDGWLGAYPALPDDGDLQEHAPGGGDLGAPTPPARFAKLARGWVAAGASIVGGCCGTTPQHIAALRAELGSG